MSLWTLAYLTIPILYIRSKTFEHLIGLFFFLPGLALLGAFIGLLNGHLDNWGEILLWAIGVPTAFFALKPR